MKILVIGAGLFGQEHILRLADMTGIELAIADVRADAARVVAERQWWSRLQHPSWLRQVGAQRQSLFPAWQPWLLPQADGLRSHR